MSSTWFDERYRWKTRGVESVEDRFQSKLFHEPNTGCYLWGGAVDKDGYGKFQVLLAPEMKQVHVRAHRFALASHLGRWVQGNVLHSCDTPACCNPEHLLEGTQVDNIADKVKKGRQARGLSHGSRTRPESVRRGGLHWKATIEECDAERIIRLVGEGVPKATIARNLGVSVSVVYAIGLGKTWRHLPRMGPQE